MNASELLKKENEINKKLFDIFLKCKDCDFTRWMDAQKLCYPCNLTLYAWVYQEKIHVGETVVVFYNAYIPQPCDIEFAGRLDEDRYPGVSGKCIAYLKTNKPELYEEIKEYITED